MIRGDKTGFFVICDVCQDVGESVYCSSFSLAVDTAKEEGWKITKKNGEWQHVCPDCQEESE